MPGHGDLTTRQEIEKRLHEAEAERNQIKELVAQGKTLQQVEAAVGDPAPSEANGPGHEFPPFSETVYNEMTKK